MRTEAQLLGQAVATTGLADFGENQDFRVGLRVLIASATESASLSETQTDGLEAAWLANLAVRYHLDGETTINMMEQSALTDTFERPK